MTEINARLRWFALAGFVLLGATAHAQSTAQDATAGHMAGMTGAAGTMPAADTHQSAPPPPPFVDHTNSTAGGM